MPSIFLLSNSEYDSIWGDIDQLEQATCAVKAAPADDWHNTGSRRDNTASQEVNSWDP